MPDPTPHQPDSHSSEELVAYLDGELSPQENEKVEQQIRDDDEVRHEMQQYDRVWNALDGLPRATVGDKFTQTTIEMVAVEAQQKLTQQTALMPVRKRNRRWQLAGLCAAGVVLGGILMALVMPNPNRMLYMNLPVITQLDAYNEVREVEFLRARHGQEVAELLAEWGPQVEDEAKALAHMTAASFRERKQYVNNLTEEPRTDLANKARRYAGMSPPMREELTQRHETIATAPDADQLQRAMLAYYAWVSQFTELEQAKLRSFPIDKRIAQMPKMQQALERQSGMQLTPANAIALREAFTALTSDDEIIALHSKFIEGLPDFGDRPMPERGPERGLERMLRGVVQVLKKVEHRQANALVLWLAVRGDIPFAGYQEYREAIENRLLDSIDTASATRLREKSSRDRSRQLSMWLAQSRHKNKPDTATLEAYFVSGRVPAEVQQELLSMPKDRMMRELEYRYTQDPLGGEKLDDDLRRHMHEVFGRGRDGGPPFGGRGERDGRYPRDWQRGEQRDRTPQDGDRRGPLERRDRQS
ncbi:MAG: anti-sigma factor family protein [Aeoliella sp.]